MASEKELGFSIKILGTDEEISKLGKVETQLKSLAMERSSLNKAVKDGTITEQEYGQQIADINLKTKSLRSSKRELERSIEVENELLKQQGGSYNQLSSQLNNLRQQYRNLSEEERESAEGDELLQKIGSLDTELKDIDASMGQYQRNVGNYSSAFSSVGGELTKLSPMLGGIHSQFNQVNNILIIAKESLFGQTAAQEAATAATQAGTVAQTEMGAATRITTTATNSQSKSLRILRAALIATGIGAFVVLIGSLITAFASTQRGMDAINSVIRPMTAFFQRLFGLIQNFGLGVFDRLKQAINDPKQAIVDLGNSIKENLINRLEAFGVFGRGFVKILKGDFKEGFEELGDAAIQFTTGVEDGVDKIGEFAKTSKQFIDESIDAGQRLHKLQVDIEKIEIRNAKQREKLLADVKAYNDIAEDTTKTEKERSDAALKAIEANDKVLQMDKELIEAKIRLKEVQNSLNDTSRADELELEELRGELFKKETERQEARTTLRNKFNIIQDQLVRENLKIIEENNKKIEELAFAISDAEIQIMETGVVQKRAILEKERKDNINALRAKLVDEKGLNGEKLQQAKEINEKINQLIELEEKAHLKRMLELNKELNEEELNNLKELTEKKIQSSDQLAKLQILQVKEKLANEIISEDQAHRQILIIQEDAIQKRLNATRNQQVELIALRESLASELAEIVNQEQTEEVAARQKAINEQLEDIDQRNDEIKLKAQELQTELAENVKAQKEEGISWVAELFDVSEEEAESIKAQLSNLAQSVYRGFYDLKETELKRNLNRELKLIEKHQEDALEASKKRFNQEKRELERKLQSGEISQEEFNDKLANLETRLSSEKERINDKYADKEEQLRKQAFEREKDLAESQAKINAALAIIKAYATMDPISATLYSSAIAFTTGVQIAKIQAQEFELGGMLKGPSHANGGILIEAEGGEAMINKRSMASNDVLSLTGTPYEIASAINSYKGYGKAFALGGQVPYPSAPPSGILSSYYPGLTAKEMEQIAEYIVAGISNGVNDKRVFLFQGDSEDFDEDVQIVKEVQKWST